MLDKFGLVEGGKRTYGTVVRDQCVILEGIKTSTE